MVLTFHKVEEDLGEVGSVVVHVLVVLPGVLRYIKGTWLSPSEYVCQHSELGLGW